MIRNATIADSQVIADIYNGYIRDTSITFEETPVDAQIIGSRISKVIEQLNLPWIVYEEEGQIIGYAYAGQWKERSAYRYSVEVTVYLAPEQHGKGIGRKLYDELFQRLRQLNIHCALAVITLPNEASIRLHEKLGMKKVAVFPEVGLKFGKWHDVGYWHIIL